MPQIKSYPDGVVFECTDGETLLEASLKAKLPLTHICGGKAKLSTRYVYRFRGYVIGDDLRVGNAIGD